MIKRIPAWGWALAVVLAAGLLFLGLHHSGSGKAAEAAPQVTATITVAPARSETLPATLRAYGTIQPAADAAATLAAPKAAVVTQVLVGVGEEVRAGQPLLRIANAPATEQAYRQAADAVAFAQSDLARLQRLAAEHLATNDQVSAARKTLADAQAALAAQQAEGAGRASQTLVAPTAAVVTSIPVKAGDRVAQDAPLLVLARSGALVAVLNLPSDAAGAVVPGDPATITSAFGGAPYSARLGTVGRLADPTTRTIQAIAPVPAGAFPVSAAIQADVVTGSLQGLVVPRAAVVFDETGTHLFAVSGGKAHRVFVKTGADHGNDIQVSGPISSGAAVAVQGAYELQDGMSVRRAGR